MSGNIWKNGKKARCYQLGTAARMLEIANAIFQERSAAASARLQEVGLGVDRTSRNTGIAAMILAVAATVLAGVQIWVAITGYG